MFLPYVLHYRRFALRCDIDVPHGAHPVDVPDCRGGVKAALAQGRALVVFYSSGGAVASQLGHHYHAVVRHYLVHVTSAH